MIEAEFIGVSPTGQDAFEGKSQERLADVVSKLIQDDGPVSSLIGLEGPWGSGKSNLIGILQKNLEQTHHLFLYDAWGHQEDLQRRSFLEELTEELCEFDLLEKNGTEEWSEKLENLLAKKKTTKKETTPNLSTGVVTTGLIAILTPVAASIASLFDPAWWKPLIAAIPAILGVAVYLVQSFKARKLLRLNEFYRVYKENELTEIVSETIAENEPSVREFQNWMSGIAKALDRKKLIIVFDNMDRLPPENVRELWSSIHTFFAEEIFSGIRVVVPFDRAHIADAFSKDTDVANDFIRKSFSAIFRIPSPVLTDWQSFFKSKFVEAFGPDHLQFETVRQIYDLLNDSITPREVISFINDIVAIRLIADPKVELQYIALFSLKKAEILKNPVDQILDRKFLKEAERLFHNDSELADQIASLAFQVPIKSASQVALYRSIETGLRSPNSGDLKKLSAHPHFFQILEQVVRFDEIDSKQVVETLQFYKQFDDEECESRSAQYRRCWDTLALRTISEPLTNQTFASEFQPLITRTSQSVQKRFLNWFIRGVGAIEPFTGNAYFFSLEKLNEFLEDHSIDFDVQNTLLKKTVDPSTFLDYLEIAKDRYRDFKLECNPSELEKFVLERIPEGLEGMACVMNLDGFETTALVERCREAVCKDELKQESAGHFYEFYKSISGENRVELLSDVKIFSFIQSIEEDSEFMFDLLAMRIARGAEFSPTAPTINHFVENLEPKTVRKISERIQKFSMFGKLLLAYPEWPHGSLSAVLHELAVRQGGKLSITAILSEYAALREAFSNNTEIFLRKLECWTGAAKEKINSENVASVVSDEEFFADSEGLGLALSKHICSMMAEHFDGLSPSEWECAFENGEESFVFNVCRKLLEQRAMKTLPGEAVRAYKDRLFHMAKEEESFNSDVWEIFYERTHKNKLAGKIIEIRDLYFREIDISIEAFLAFGKMLFAKGKLHEKSGDTIRHIFTPVIEDRECLDLILDNAKETQKVIKSAQEEAFDLIEKLTEIAENSKNPQLEGLLSDL